MGSIGPFFADDVLGATFLVDPTGCIVHWSDGAARLVGAATEAAVGRKCWDVLADAVRCRPACAVFQARDAGCSPAPFELRVRGRRLLCSAVVLRRQTGRYVLYLLHPVSPPTPPPGLTRRELDVLTCLARGLTTKALAAELDIRHHTARNHVRGVLRKLGARTQLQAVVTAMRLGVVDVAAEAPRRPEPPCADPRRVSGRS